jgi:molybdate transport system substrate-binding protein
VEAFKRALLDAKSIAYTEAGASGIHFSGLTERLGIAAQVKAKARTRPGGLIGELVANGEAELAVQQIPELLAVPGIELVGPLPHELQVTNTVTAAVFVDARQPDAARAFLEFLSTPAAARVFKANGLDPA